MCPTEVYWSLSKCLRVQCCILLHMCLYCIAVMLRVLICGKTQHACCRCCQARLFTHCPDTTELPHCHRLCTDMHDMHDMHAVLDAHSRVLSVYWWRNSTGMMLQRPVLRSASTSMSVVLPAPEAPIRAVSTPGLKAPVMPCHTDRQTEYSNVLEAQTEIYTNAP